MSEVNLCFLAFTSLFYLFEPKVQLIIVSNSDCMLCQRLSRIRRDYVADGENRFRWKPINRFVRYNCIVIQMNSTIFRLGVNKSRHTKHTPCNESVELMFLLTLNLSQGHQQCLLICFVSILAIKKYDRNHHALEREGEHMKLAFHCMGESKLWYFKRDSYGTRWIRRHFSGISWHLIDSISVLVVRPLTALTFIIFSSSLLKVWIVYVIESLSPKWSMIQIKGNRFARH